MLARFVDRYAQRCYARTMLTRSYSQRQPSEDDARAKAFLASFNIDTLPKEGCTVTFSRSSGPGGQNVNKLNTKATLRLPRSKQGWIPAVVLDRLRQSQAQYLTKEGDVVIHAQRSRAQEQNRQEAYEKLAGVLREAAGQGMVGETSQATQKRVGNLMRKDNAIRLKLKKRQADKKSARRVPRDD